MDSLNSSPSEDQNNKIFNNSDNYIMLLKRLDEDEGISEPSIEEKLKLTEDYLRLSSVKFCELTSNLFGIRKEGDGFATIEPDVIQGLFEAENLKPSYCPPKSQMKFLAKQKKSCSTQTSIQELKFDNDAVLEKVQETNYLPPSFWLSTNKPNIDLSKEEIELLSSCVTKSFIKFLGEKKMEVPQIFDIHSQKYAMKRKV